ADISRMLEKHDCSSMLTPLEKNALLTGLQSVKHDCSSMLTPLAKHALLTGLQASLHGIWRTNPASLHGIWRTNPVRRYKPTPEDEARYGLSVVEQSIWEALPEHYHAVDYALQQ
ncbi:hypothetical protein T484DRAFT_1820701, partial [Baffinella frigidus]